MTGYAIHLSLFKPFHKILLKIQADKKTADDACTKDSDDLTWKNP